MFVPLVFLQGYIDLQTMRPHRKNPKIAKVFSQMGIVEELGCSMRKMFKYILLQANGKEPVIEEQDVSRIEIPYIPTFLPNSEESGKKSGKELEEVIKDAIRKDLSITIQNLREIAGLSKTGIWNVLNRMKNQNKIKRIGPDKCVHWEVIE